VTKFNGATSDSPAFQFAGTSVSHSNSIPVLGITIDQYLTFDSHVSKIVQLCNYHIQGLHHIHQLISKDMANTLSCSIVGCQLDYCNALLYRMSPKETSIFNSLQRIQNSLARIVCNALYRCLAQPFLKSLHWLPIIKHVAYKLAAMTKFDYTISHHCHQKSKTHHHTSEVKDTSSQSQFPRQLKGHLFQRIFG
jgi:hypothetical protein